MEEIYYQLGKNKLGLKKVQTSDSSIPIQRRDNAANLRPILANTICEYNLDLLFFKFQQIVGAD